VRDSRPLEDKGHRLEEDHAPTQKRNCVVDNEIGGDQAVGLYRVY